MDTARLARNLGGTYFNMHATNSQQHYLLIDFNPMIFLWNPRQHAYSSLLQAPTRPQSDLPQEGDCTMGTGTEYGRCLLQGSFIVLSRLYGLTGRNDVIRALVLKKDISPPLYQNGLQKIRVYCSTTAFLLGGQLPKLAF